MSDEGEGANRLESLLLNTVFALVAVVLLAVIGMATKSGSSGAGWWTKPAMMPGVALVLLVAANAITLGRAFAEVRTVPPGPAERAAAKAAIIGWLRPLEFLAYFAGYLWLLGHAGYALATLIFVQFLLFRVGLRTFRWRLTGLLFVVALIGVFRIGLGVWMPAPPLYDIFPDALRSLLIRWF